MILGAGVYQLPLIRTAKEMGIYTIVTSIPGNYPGFEAADKVYYENTTDQDAILEIAKKEKIDGVLTAGTDVAVITEGRICDELGLTGPSYEAAKISTDKFLMKQCYEKHGVRSARYRGVQIDDENYADAIADLQFPLIFKSVDSSGSRDIVRVDSTDEFEAARRTVLENTRSDHFIVEEFIEGEEFGAQAFVQDGKLEFILPHGDYIMKRDAGVPYGHYAPYTLDDTVLRDTHVQLERAIRAMGCDNCAVNADFILKDGEIYILEIGARGGGACLMDLTSIYFGFNYYEKIIGLAMGEHIDFFPEGSPVYVTDGTPNACRMLRSDRDGVIVSQEDLNEPHPDIVDIRLDYKVGDRVREFKVSPDRIGHVITKGKSLDDAVALLNKAIDNIHIEIR